MADLNHNEKKGIPHSSSLRSEKIKEIDAIYRNQIKEIYAETKAKLDKQDSDSKKNASYAQG